MITTLDSAARREIKIENRAADSAEKLRFFSNCFAAQAAQINAWSVEDLGLRAIAAAAAEAWAESEGPLVTFTWRDAGDDRILEATIATDEATPPRIIARAECAAFWADHPATQRLIRAQVAADAREQLKKWCGVCLACGQWTPANVIHNLSDTRIAMCSTCDGLDGPDGIANMPDEVHAGLADSITIGQPIIKAPKKTNARHHDVDARGEAK